MRPRRPLATAVVIAIVAACGTAPTTPSAGSSVLPASSSPSAAAIPTVNPTNLAPAELQGTWNTTLADGEQVTLRLRPTGYSIDRGSEHGSGNIAVEADSITFFGGRCDGTGVYTWAITDGVLRFVKISEDCGGRLEVLPGVDYRR